MSQRRATFYLPHRDAIHAHMPSMLRFLSARCHRAYLPLLMRFAARYAHAAVDATALKPRHAIYRRDAARLLMLFFFCAARDAS